MKRTLGTRVWAQIVLRGNAECVYCMKDLKVHSGQLTIDHVQPRYYLRNLGFNEQDINSPANLVVACQPCNSRKRHTRVERFASAEAMDRIKAQIIAPLPEVPASPQGLAA